MECANCHADNVEGALFCASCGTSMASRRTGTSASSELAGRGSRLLAAIIDGVIYGVPYVLILTSAQVIVVLLLVAVFVIQIVLLTKDGQTLGKKATGIRIVRMQTGENGGFVTNVLLRLVVNGLLGLIPFYGLVDILFIFRDDRRCIHDMIAGTQVVEAQSISDMEYPGLGSSQKF